MRALSGRADVPILIDQEGGRVARMREPEWPAFPAAEAFDRLYRTAPSSALEAVRSNARALALLLREAGINVNCLPVLDVRQEGADAIVGDRALGAEPMQVAALGKAVLDGMASAGVVGVVKHMPGHGRALADSHKERPVITASDAELAVDLEPFERLRHAPMGMIAHLVYNAWDPELPASLSRVVVEDIIRGRIGFDGWLISDDIGMEALEGDAGERAAGVIAAGCDVALHCSGRMDEMVLVAAATPAMTAAEPGAAGAGDGDGPRRRRRPRLRRLRRQARRASGACLSEAVRLRPMAEQLRLVRDEPDQLTLSLDGWEGPLDLLLELARGQKVDLTQISILDLVEQYLAFLADARALKLEIAADYLVMAAWLAYLKSCLLLPREAGAEPDADEIALRLQLRLQRLDAMREAGARLLGRDRIGRDVFARGEPEGLRLIRKANWQVSPFDLFAAYGAVKARTQPPMHVVHARSVMTLDEAIDRVGRLLGMALDWTAIEEFLPQSDDPQLMKSALASSFLAALELARQGRLELAQDEAFAQLKLRAA